MVSKTDKLMLAGDSGELTDSEEEEEEGMVTAGPQSGAEPVQIPTTSHAPAANSGSSYLPRPPVENSEVSSHAVPSDEDETIPIINPIARCQLKRAEQRQQQEERHSSLRLREKGLNSKPP